MGIEELNDLPLEQVIDGFEEIGQTDMDLDIELTAGMGLDGVPDLRDQPGVSYPCMLISGVVFNDALRVLKAGRKQTYRLVDAWFDLADGNPPVLQGTLALDSQTFAVMRYLGLTVTLYQSEDVIETLDLEDPSTLERFI